MPRFTDKWLRGLAVTRPREFCETGFSEFGVFATPAGRRIWFVRYFDEVGKRRRHKFGEHPASKVTRGRPYPELTLREARLQAKAILDRVAAGENPAAERETKKTEPTFLEFSKIYIERHARPKKRTWREDEPHDPSRHRARDRRAQALQQSRACPG